MVISGLIKFLLIMGQSMIVLGALGYLAEGTWFQQQTEDDTEKRRTMRGLCFKVILLGTLVGLIGVVTDMHM